MILECRVCNEIFRIQGDKVPRLLICGHTVCHQCLTRLPLHGRTMLCPYDRQPTEIGDSGVWGLKKNFALLELLEKLQNPQQTPCRILSDSIMAREQSVRTLLLLLKFFNPNVAANGTGNSASSSIHKGVDIKVTVVVSLQSYHAKILQSCL